MRCLRAAVAALLSCCLLDASALAQNKSVKIGVLDDMSGPYAENTGPGDVAAAKFAIADFGKHGLVLETSSDALRNPGDDRSKPVFDPAVRGKTDRFVHLYRKQG